MPPLPNLVRAAALVVTAGIVCSCTTVAKSGSGRGVPSTSAEVVGGRFVSEVNLDNGGLVVDPPGTTKPSVPAGMALAMFHAADVVGGDYRFSVFGLGAVTVSTQVPMTTTTGPATATTTSAAGAAPTPQGNTSTTSPSSTTATGGAPTTTTTTATAAGPGATQSTAASAPQAPGTGALPEYSGRLAWVGIAWGMGCPAGGGGSRSPTRYVAVVFDAGTGRSVIAYASRSAAVCSGPVVPASVSRPDELVSIPWQPVGPASTAVHVTLPACATYYGWTEVPGTGSSSVQVVARVPFDAECSSSAPITETVDDVVPLGSSQTQLPHAALGPVDALRTLPRG